VNFGAATRNQSSIRFALQGGPTPLQQLNQQFVAAQLSLLDTCGHYSPQSFTVLEGNLSCSGLNFRPLTLSNGVNLSVDSRLKDLFEQARFAIRDNRTTDMVVLANLFGSLRRCSP
jgi:hypothetical protein